MLENASKLLECVLRARAGDHMAVEYDVRAAGAVVRRVGERLEQVSPRVAVRHFDRFLRAGKDDRLQIPCTRYDIVAAAYAIVSVPCAITKPSYFS